MLVSLQEGRIEFTPWRPECGRVFSTAFAFDCETTLVDHNQPWSTPEYVLGAASDATRGWFICRDHVGEFFRVHEGVPVVMHHAVFDLAVLQRLVPELDAYGWVGRDRVWDTQLLHRLYMLDTEGHTAGGKGESTLDHCVDRYLGVQMDKDVMDSAGNPVRLSYGQWLDQPPSAIEPVYLQYLAQDAGLTYLLFKELSERLRVLRESAGHAFGFVSAEWLDAETARWGPQTHFVQLKASIVLQAVSANGFCVNLDRRNALLTDLEAERQRHLKGLRSLGFAPGPGSKKVLQAILGQIQAEHPDAELPRTRTGQSSTSAKSLATCHVSHPFLDLYRKYVAVDKLAQFVKKMSRATIHPSFDILMTTGRTSSFGELNAQNLPRDDRVRSCFVPSAGHVFVDADYRMAELVTLGQACLRQFGLDSALAKVLNDGQDPHRFVAARMRRVTVDEVTDEDRRRAKAINFGKPGGMGDAALRDYAEATYGIALTETEVRTLAEAWFNIFPEMRAFLEETSRDAGAAAAHFFGLTPEAYREHTGSDRFQPRPDDPGPRDKLDSILGWMFLKTLATDAPTTKKGRLYSAEEIDFFWSRLEQRLDAIDRKQHDAIRARQPSPELRKAVMNVLDRRGVFTLTGRLRAKANYTARHNTVFQGLAADAAKLALWKLWRAGYRIVNFIHDEVLIEVPQDGDLTSHAARIENLMIEAMREVVPDVHVGVELAASDRWTKKAKEVRDSDGQLLLWQPTDPGQAA